MASKSSRHNPNSQCFHEALTFEPSSHAAEVGYKSRTLQTRINASLFNPSSKDKKHALEEGPLYARSFPAPLVLPGDELAYDPKYPAQSLSTYIKEKDRNPVTKKKNVLYVAASPGLDANIAFLSDWVKALQSGSQPNNGNQDGDDVRPETDHVIDYLSAFYTGLPVKPFPDQTKFTAWEDDSPISPAPKGNKGKKRKRKDAEPQYIGLNISSEIVGIRVRTCPDGTFSHQLNLNDLLDAAMSMLPDDAYALLLLVDHDIYEDDDDDFACGRAYGNSRIAVVSTARYNPTLDAVQRVERMHAWPASHCCQYVNENENEHEDEDGDGNANVSGQHAHSKPISPTTKRGKVDSNVARDTPMHAAVSAHKSLPLTPLNPSVPNSRYDKDIAGLWLGRVCRTASHELGHCLGMDHCIYYACAMQGTASISEDARQPPYLCPVDLAKWQYMTQGNVKERYEALLKFCLRFPDVQLFAAYGAWIKGRLEDMHS